MKSIKSLFSRIHLSKDLILISDSNDMTYFNLSKVVSIFRISRKDRMAPNDYIFGFNIMFEGGLYLSVNLETEVDDIPQLLVEIRDLFIHNMGQSFVSVDGSYYKDIKFTFRKL